jgi:hypothetical protein
VFVRAIGVETIVAADSTDAHADAADADSNPPTLAPNCETARIVRGHTPEGGRPEPLRVARLAARAGREFAGTEH